MSSPKVLPLRAVRKPTPAGVLLSLTEVCARLGVRERYVYALAHEGRLRTVMVGGWQKYLSWEVDALKNGGPNGGPGVFPDGPVSEPYPGRVFRGQSGSGAGRGARAA
jgi:excisionase family DNA binding protein